MLQVLGDHLGETYVLGQFDTNIEAQAVKSREERNEHYENIVVRDYDEYAANEYAKLPQEELERLARVGDHYARMALGGGVPSKEDKIANLRAQIAELEGKPVEPQTPSAPEVPKTNGGGE